MLDADWSLGVVIQTGNQTVFGRIAKLSATGAPSLTTLQREILRFVIIIVSLALSIALLVVILWGAWLNRSFPGFITNSNLVIDVVSVCVAFIPEGLPSCVTISLAVIANTLAKNKVLCKSLMTVETLGAVSVLCSDKTGTLTKNQMTVTNAAVLGDQFDATEARDRIIARADNASNVKQIAAVAGVCNSAVFVDATMDQPIGLRAVNGDATGETRDLQCCKKMLLTVQTRLFLDLQSLSAPSRTLKQTGPRSSSSASAPRPSLCSRQVSVCDQRIIL
jgi:sodium/potassium-transporting ATPase subunit alpha